jgi:hypothetical protein
VGWRVVNLFFLLLGEEVIFLETVLEILREVLKGIVREVVKVESIVDFSFME